MTVRSRILLVEDEPELREDLAIELREMDYVVDEAGDGLAALTLALTQRFDLVLCDVRLPRLGGMELLAELRRGGSANSGVPFVFTTAYADDALRRQADSLGGTHYLVKPIDFDRLFALIAELTAQDHC